MKKHTLENGRTALASARIPEAPAEIYAITADGEPERMEAPDTTFFIVATSELRWGAGASLEEAARNARAVSRDGKRWKKGIIVTAFVNWQGPSHVYGPLMAEGARQSHITLSGYSNGDRVKPFVGCYGNVIAWGKTAQIYHTPEE